MRPMIITALRRAMLAVWVVMVIAAIGLAAWSHLGTPLIITGSSMDPAIPQGALITPTAVDTVLIAAGDIVSVKADNGIILTHRVARVLDLAEGRHFELKGDANTTADPELVPARAVMGRVDLVVPHAGYALALLSTPSGLVSLLTALGALLVGIWLLEDLESQTRRTVRAHPAAKTAHATPG